MSKYGFNENEIRMTKMVSIKRLCLMENRNRLIL